MDLANPPRNCPECLQKKKKSKVKLKVFNGELKIFCKNEEVKDRITNFRVLKLILLMVLVLLDSRRVEKHKT